MGKLLSVKFSLAALVFILFLSAVPAAKAAGDLADGTYKINYTVLRADNDSVSIANDYWEKPAVLTVKNGEMTVRHSLNHSAWITEYKVPDLSNDGNFVDVDVISEDKNLDKKTVQFKVADLSAPLECKIHVTVESANYDHSYTIRLSFDTSSIEPIKETELQRADDAANTKTQGDAANQSHPVERQHSQNSADNPADNPATADTAPIVPMTVMLLVSMFFLFRAFSRTPN